jgi:hypothetical protein
MVESREKTTACTRETSTPITRNGHRHQERHHGEEDGGHLVVGHDVAEEPQRQRHRAGHVADQLDGQHQRRQPPDRPQEVLEVGQAVSAQAEDVGQDEHHHPQHHRGLQRGGGRQETRDQAHQVREQDEEEERADDGQEALGVLGAKHALHQAVDGVGQHLEQVAQPEARRRDEAGVARGAHGAGVAHGPEGQEQQHHQAAQDVGDLEVGGLEDLPGPLPAQIDLKVGLQRGQTGQEIEPGAVFTHL